MTQANIQANQFVLKEHQTEITYETTTFDGQPQLTYRVSPGSPTRNFQGDQIRLQESEIGTQVTVTLVAVDDGDMTLLTLLVPTIHLASDTTEQHFKTIAIVTTVQGSIAGPSLIKGPVQSYHILKLEGKAQFVVS